MNTFLWVIFPYLSIVVLIGGTVWRHRYDKFGWTTRSSQLYERRLLRLGSPLFHLGILLVAAGHVGGLLIPESWTANAGISEAAYHAASFGIGTVAGIAAVGGAAILIYRRRTVRPVFSATTRNDKIMYALLAGTMLLGLATTVLGNVTGHPHDYRQTVSPWFRSLFALHPRTELILRAPIGFRLHVLAARDAVAPDRLGRPSGDPRIAARLSGLMELVGRGSVPVPGALLAAAIHGELLALSPFAGASGVVARAAARLTLIASGLDPRGLLPIEVGHLEREPEYQGVRQAFTTGTPDGLRAWLIHSANALTLAADELIAICDRSG